LSRAVTVHADAAAEVEAAAAWYDDQHQGLGLQFLAAVDRAIQHARAWPLSGTAVMGLPPDLGVRRLPVSRFPYHLAPPVVDVSTSQPYVPAVTPSLVRAG
jgi:toxin ParE1/3/4